MICNTYQIVYVHTYIYVYIYNSKVETLLDCDKLAVPYFFRFQTKYISPLSFFIFLKIHSSILVQVYKMTGKQRKGVVLLKRVISSDSTKDIVV